MAHMQGSTMQVKSLKFRKKSKSEGASSMNRALQHFDRLNLGSEKCKAEFSEQKQSKRYRLYRCASLMDLKIIKISKIGEVVGYTNRASYFELFNLRSEKCQAAFFGQK